MKRLFIVLVAIVVTILSACSAPTDLAQPRVDTPELDGSKIIMISNPGATVDFHSPSLKSYLAAKRKKVFRARQRFPGRLISKPTATR